MPDLHSFHLERGLYGVHYGLVGILHDTGISKMLVRGDDGW